MSKETHRYSVDRSRLIPKTYKKQYNDDLQELKDELEQSRTELNTYIKKLSKKEVRKLRVFLSIA